MFLQTAAAAAKAMSELWRLGGRDSGIWRLLWLLLLLLDAAAAAAAGARTCLAMGARAVVFHK